MRLLEVSKRHWAQFRADVWDDPTIRPGAGVLLSLVVGVVTVLSIQYGTTAVSRSTECGPLELASQNGEIDPAWGRATLLLVATVTLAAGLEPILTRQLERLGSSFGNRWWKRGIGLRWLLAGTALALSAPAKLMSFIWSVADYLLARPIAALAGATWTGITARYLHLGGLLTCLLAITGVAEYDILDKRIGLLAIAIASILMLGIIRRWSWIERDRDTFLVERGERSNGDAAREARRPSREIHNKIAGSSAACLALLCIIPICIPFLGIGHPQPAVLALLATFALLLALIFMSAVLQIWLDPGPSAFRIGFAEDLRDEALIALVVTLLFLIPLGLDLTQQITAGEDNPAFQVDCGSLLAGTFPTRYWTWLGYFGAELAKTVPFVDWSEVFNVQNGSPIKPRSTLGSILTFTLRATLDIVFLATILQAIQIAYRTREQRSAFWSGRLPILDPFSEQPLLLKHARAIDYGLSCPPTLQPTIYELPQYDKNRLNELVAQSPNEDVRRLSIALLEAQYPSEEVDEYLNMLYSSSTSAADREWIYATATRQPLTELIPYSDHEIVSRLYDSRSSTYHRRRIIRALPAQVTPELTITLRAMLLDRRLALSVRSAVATRLLPNPDDEYRSALLAICRDFSSGRHERDTTTAATIGYCLSVTLYDECAKIINDHFLNEFAEFAVRGSRIEPHPESPPRSPAQSTWDRTITIHPGAGPFPPSFWMGSQVDGKSFKETPRRHIQMSDTPFHIGPHCVTNQEFALFAKSRNIRVGSHTSPLQPVHEISWKCATEYCEWLSAITGDTFRLPKETEWEYCCKAGRDSAYFWGDNPDDTAHYAVYATDGRRGRAEPAEVGTKKPNPWGLYDMSGNVWEWCSDPWRDSLSGPAPDGSLWNDPPELQFRCRRGGAYFNYPDDIRSAIRNRINPSSARIATGVGLRLVRETRR